MRAELCAKCSAIIFIICSAVLLVACCVWLATSVIKNYCLPAGKYLGCWVSLFIFCFPFASLCLYGCVCSENTRPNGVRCKCAEYLGDFFLSFSPPLAGTLTHASRNGSGVVCFICSLFCVLRALLSVFALAQILILLRRFAECFANGNVGSAKIKELRRIISSVCSLNCIFAGFVSLLFFLVAVWNFIIS